MDDRPERVGDRCRALVGQHRDAQPAGGAVQLSADGQHYVAVGNAGVIYGSTTSGVLQQVAVGYYDGISQLQLSADGLHFAFVDTSGPGGTRDRSFGNNLDRVDAGRL